MHRFLSLALGQALITLLPWVSPTLAGEAPSTLNAGAFAVDIAPATFPVRVNGMFTERTADQITDPLFAKAIAVEDDQTRIVFCVVDTCMMSRDLIDQAKAHAARITGLPMDRMLVSATHTHSAPSAMGCLGSRMDPAYAAYLPGRIAEAISGAIKRLAPARVGWAQIDDWEHTFNRRWIRRPDKLFNDPFGEATVRAHMHPGYLNPDAIGPSGPVDPQLSVLAFQHLDGRPLAVLANYSMHYYDSPLLSSDYFGRFSGHLKTQLKADESFVAIMSQGTSGDLARLDYGGEKPATDLGYDSYAAQLADKTVALLNTLQWRDHAPIRMAQRALNMDYRVPTAERLAWAREVVSNLGDRLPQTQPEIYAMEAVYLHERPRTELLLQAVALGDLGITALPNEVYALTGLKLKRQSPFPATFNIELANGSEGYIPPPEQHRLGGYTTWPARTAGLEVQAEPKIVETTLSLLEEIANRPRRELIIQNGPYADTILGSSPEAYWRLEEMAFPTAQDATGKHPANFEDGIALYLPGADMRRGFHPNKLPAPNNFSALAVNRSVHFAGGRMVAPPLVQADYSIEFWLWNGLPSDQREITGYAYSRGRDNDATACGEHLAIGGIQTPEYQGKLVLSNGNTEGLLLGGKTPLAFRAWHHVILTRQGEHVRVHLDGEPVPEIEGDMPLPFFGTDHHLFFGGRSDNSFNLEGRLDEIAIYQRALTPQEINAHYRASGLTPPTHSTALPDEEPPLSPKNALHAIRVRDGYSVELMAAEPLVLDPVAIDWDARGRLWVVEMADYPLGLDGKGQPGGRVRVLTDSNQDGHYDTQTLFADGLSFPNGLLVWRDGVLVTAAPDILFLRDLDDDGHADASEVLVTGLSTGNQQLRANGLRWGFDGWVYCAAGGHYGEYAADTRLKTRSGEVMVGSRDFRFRPNTGELEPESGPSQFGRNRDDWGHWFGTQNSRPLWHYVLPDYYLRRNPYVATPDPKQMVVVPVNPRVFPASRQQKRFHSFDQAGRFTSACSGMIYRDTLLFSPAADEQHAFTCEPFHNLVQHNLITPDGVTFAAHRDAPEGVVDFFASEDRWCRPVMARTGPDGALWVVDMYRYMIEHPDWLPELGREELLPKYRAGDDRGRIYRVFPSDTRPRPATQLDQLSPGELVAALDSPNGWQRDRAHMMLQWDKNKDAIQPLRTLAKTGKNPLGRLHALALLDEFDDLQESDLVHALKEDHAGLRENALRVAEHHETPSVLEAAAQLVADPDPKVRLQFGLSAGEWNGKTAGEGLARLATLSGEDPFIHAAILSSALPHLVPLVEWARESKTPVQRSMVGDLFEIALALDNRPALDALARPIFTPKNGTYTHSQMESATGLLITMHSHQGDIENLLQGNDALSDLLQKSLKDPTESIFIAARKAVLDKDSPTELRQSATRLLVHDPAGGDEVVALVSSLLTPQTAGELQQAALNALSQTGNPQVPEVLINRWTTLSPEHKSIALQILLTREPWAFSLVESIRDGIRVPLDASQRARLLQHNSARVRNLATSVLETPSSRKQVLVDYQPALQLQGDANRAHTIYENTCAKCHRLGTQGGNVGPDLSSVANHPPAKLLTNILDPSADVQPGYYAYECELQDGTELFGLVTTETGNSITIKTAEGDEHIILRRNITSLRSTSLSLMPEGLETGLSHQELADLIALLRQAADQ